MRGACCGLGGCGGRRLGQRWPRGSGSPGSAAGLAERVSVPPRRSCAGSREVPEPGGGVSARRCPSCRKPRSASSGRSVWRASSAPSRRRAGAGCRYGSGAAPGRLRAAPVRQGRAGPAEGRDGAAPSPWAGSADCPPPSSSSPAAARPLLTLAQGSTSRTFVPGAGEAQRERGPGYFCCAGCPPQRGLFLCSYASYKYEPIPQPPPLLPRQQSAGLSHLVLIRAWGGRGAGSLGRHLLHGWQQLHPSLLRCPAASLHPHGRASALNLPPGRQQHPWPALVRGHVQVCSSLAFQVISDFDMTLSRFGCNGRRCPTSHSESKLLFSRC